MLEAAERLLRQHGARKVTLSYVAAACGMSQSNAYRFFASRQALLDAVGDRWFAGIERELEQIVASNEPPAQQFVRFVARQYEFKRERAVEDPERILPRPGGRCWTQPRDCCASTAPAR